MFGLRISSVSVGKWDIPIFRQFGAQARQELFYRWQKFRLLSTLLADSWKYCSKVLWWRAQYEDTILWFVPTPMILSYYSGLALRDCADDMTRFWTIILTEHVIATGMMCMTHARDGHAHCTTRWISGVTLWLWALTSAFPKRFCTLSISSACIGSRFACEPIQFRLLWPYMNVRRLIGRRHRYETDFYHMVLRVEMCSMWCSRLYWLTNALTPKLYPQRRFICQRSSLCTETSRHGSPCSLFLMITINIIVRMLIWRRPAGKQVRKAWVARSYASENFYRSRLWTLWG